MSKFEKPYLENIKYDSLVIGELFNYASNFDLEGLRREAINNKVSLNVLNNNNENLIHIVLKSKLVYATEEKRLKIVKYLVSKGVHLDLANDQGVTPLHIACENQYETIVKYLLKCGVNTNNRDVFGKTPLHYLLSGLIKPWYNNTNKPLYIGTRNKESKEMNDKKREINSQIEKIFKDSDIQEEIQNVMNEIIYGLFTKDENVKVINEIRRKILETTPRLDIDESVTDIGYDNTAIIQKYKSVLDELKDYLDCKLQLKYEDNYDKNISEHILEEKKKNKKNVNDLVITNISTLKKFDKECAESKTEFKNANDNSIFSSLFPYYNPINNTFIANDTDGNNFTFDESSNIINIINNSDSMKSLAVNLLRDINYNNKNYLRLNLPYHGMFLSGQQNSIDSQFMDNGAVIPHPVIPAPLPAPPALDAALNVAIANEVVNFNAQTFENLDDIKNLVENNIHRKYSSAALGHALNKDQSKSNLICLLYIYLLQCVLELTNKNSLKDLFDEYEIRSEDKEILNRILDMNYISGCFNALLYICYLCGNFNMPDTLLHFVKLVKDRQDLIGFRGNDLLNKYLNISYYNSNIYNNPGIDDLPENKTDRFIDKDIGYIRNNNHDRDYSLGRSNNVNNSNFSDMTHRRIYENDNIARFLINSINMILPSNRNVSLIHLLIEELSDTCYNQGFYASKILRANFIGNVENITVDNTVTVENNRFRSGTDKTVKYITKNSIETLYKKNICKLISIYRYILEKGDFPLLKILALDDDTKFNSYFNKLVPFHLRSLSILENYIKYFSQLGNMRQFNIQQNSGEYLEFINNTSVYNYLLEKLSNPSADVIEVPNFYYNGFSNGFRKVLSFGNSYAKDLQEHQTNFKINNKNVDELQIPEHKEYFDEINDYLLKTKINNSKLRIGRNDPIPIIENNSEIVYSLGIYDKIHKVIEANKDVIENMIKESIRNNVFDKEELIEEYVNKYIIKYINKLAKTVEKRFVYISSIELLLGKDLSAEIENLLKDLQKEYSENISIDNIEIDIDSIEDNKKPSVFPIIEKNKVNSNVHFYFSNDYSNDSFVDRLYEIKFNKNILCNLMNNGANLFLVDKQNESPIQILTTNYFIEPLKILKDMNNVNDVMIDLKQKDNNGFDFRCKLESELEYHNSFLRLQKDNFKEISKDFIDPFYKELKDKMTKTEIVGFNNLRYGRLSLELTLLYLISNENILDHIEEQVIESDIVLAKQLLSDKSKPSTRRLNLDSYKIGDIIDNYKSFTEDVFYISPAVFLHKFDSILSENKLVRNNLNNLNVDVNFAQNYFMNKEFTDDNDATKKIREIYLLVSRQVLSTQIIYILTNLVNAHLSMKLKHLTQNERMRIISIDILDKILPKRNNNNIIDILNNELLPKLIKSILFIYDDEIDKNDSENFTVGNLGEELVNLLKLLTIYFEDNDKLLSDVIPNYLVPYLETYLPEMIRAMRLVVENTLKLIINYKKLSDMKNLIE